MRLSLLLIAAIMVSAFFVVRTQYESRRLVMQLETAQRDAHLLQVEQDRLQAEARQAVNTQRVDQVARQRLGMFAAPPGATEYVKQGSATAMAPNASSESLPARSAP